MRKPVIITCAPATTLIGPAASCGETGMYQASHSAEIFFSSVMPPVQVTSGMM